MQIQIISSVLHTIIAVDSVGKTFTTSDQDYFGVSFDGVSEKDWSKIEMGQKIIFMRFRQIRSDGQRTLCSGWYFPSEIPKIHGEFCQYDEDGIEDCPNLLVDHSYCLLYVCSIKNVDRPYESVAGRNQLERKFLRCEECLKNF